MPVIWSSAARHDVARIFHFNMAYSEARATQVEARLIGAGDLIERNPLIGRPIAGSSLRERSLPDIQYVIRYRIGIDGDITILRVRSTRENTERP